MTQKICECGQTISWNEIKHRYYNYINGVGGIHGTPHRCPKYVNPKFKNLTPPKPQLQNNPELCCPSCGITYYANIFVLCPNCFKCKCDRCHELRTYKTGLNLCPECGNKSFEVEQTKEYVDNLINKLRPT